MGGGWLLANVRGASSRRRTYSPQSQNSKQSLAIQNVTTSICSSPSQRVHLSSKNASRTSTALSVRMLLYEPASGKNRACSGGDSEDVRARMSVRRELAKIYMCWLEQLCHEREQSKSGRFSWEAGGAG